MTHAQLIASQSIQSQQGRLGEDFVLQYERKRLPEHLACKVHLLGEEDIAHGYDILSCHDADSVDLDCYIEVKTYVGHPHFYLSENELETARRCYPHYRIYLVDIERISDASYSPTIIDNPLTLFREQSEWSSSIHSYAFSLASLSVPSDWDEAIIVVGCYRDMNHLQWILSHNAYNVRLSSHLSGAVNSNNPVVHNARYLLLYSAATNHCYRLFRLSGVTDNVSLATLVERGYSAHRDDPNAHYLLYEIAEEISSPHIDIGTLLRQLGRWKMDSANEDLLTGTPIYVQGREFVPYMEKTTIQPIQRTLSRRAFAQSLYPNYGHPMTDEDKVRLVALYRQGLTLHDMAIALGRAPWTISTYLKTCRQLGILSGATPPESLFLSHKK